MLQSSDDRSQQSPFLASTNRDVDTSSHAHGIHDQRWDHEAETFQPLLEVATVFHYLSAMRPARKGSASFTSWGW